MIKNEKLRKNRKAVAVDIKPYVHCFIKYHKSYQSLKKYINFAPDEDRC